VSRDRKKRAPPAFSGVVPRKAAAILSVPLASSSRARWPVPRARSRRRRVHTRSAPHRSSRASAADSLSEAVRREVVLLLGLPYTYCLPVPQFPALPDSSSPMPTRDRGCTGQPSSSTALGDGPAAAPGAMARHAQLVQQRQRHRHASRRTTDSNQQALAQPAAGPGYAQPRARPPLDSERRSRRLERGRRVPRPVTRRGEPRLHAQRAPAHRCAAPSWRGG